MGNQESHEANKDRSSSTEDDKKKEDKLITHQLPDTASPWMGALSITIILGGMTLGPLSPFLLLIGAIWYPVVSLTTLVMLIASMYTAQYSETWCRFYLRASSWFKNGVFLHFEPEAVKLFAKSKSIWCMHPHGTAFGFGFSLNGAVRFRANRPKTYVMPELDEILTTKRQLTCEGVMAPLLFNIPVVRQMLMGFGCCTPATKSAMHQIMRKEQDFGILPGGMEEVALYTFQKERVFLSKRAGFIKYALQHGYLLLPGYTFGECDMYNSWTGGADLLMWVQKNLGFVLPVFWGPIPFMPWLPNPDIAVHTVVGAPLQLPLIAEPTKEDVDKWHQKYIEALRTVFDTYKERFGYGDRELEVV